MITYLYHKQHQRTKLNYFGKTTQDPYTYTGSGTHWTRHLKKHGNDIETIQVWEFQNLDECSRFAVEFSIRNKIVESTEWANLRIENGLDGGHTPGAYTLEARIKKGKKLKGRVFSEETRAKRSATLKHRYANGATNAMLGKTQSKSTRQLMREKALGREKILCEHCSVKSSPSNYSRWHGEKCRHKKQKPLRAFVRIALELLEV